MKKLFLLLIGLTFLVAATPKEILHNSEQVLQDFLSISEKRIPHKLLQEAKAIVIVPHMIRGGFIIGGRYGEGILMVRLGSGWSDPVFVKLAGGSLGWQIGVEAIDAVLVFRTKESVEHLLEGKFTLGADASIAAGPVGRAGAAATDVKLRSEIYSYSRSRGAFVGVALNGAVLEIDYPKTQKFYDARVRDVLSGKVHKNSSVIHRLKKLLERS